MTIEREEVKVKKITFNNVFPVVTAAIGGVFLYLAFFDVGFWDESKGPLGGFYPALGAIILILVSVIAFLNSFKEKPCTFNPDDIKVCLGSLATIVGMYFVGTLVSIFAFLLLWVRLIEKKSWFFSLKFSIGIAGVTYIVFAIWLGVFFPNGIIFDALLG